MSKKIEISQVMTFFQIFVKKKWVDIEGYDDVLNRFAELASVLSKEEVELVISLTESYHWVTFSEYHSVITSLLKKLVMKSLVGKTKMYVFPIIKPENENDIKSGHIVSYIVNGIRPWIPGFNDIEILSLRSFDELSADKFTLNNEDFLLLVDDYIGSGKTLEAMLDVISKNASIDKNKCAVFAIAIQEQAKKRLENENYTVYSYLTLPKGISECYEPKEVESKLELMSRIESRIPNVGQYKYGFEQSEALITLLRTPNNTFPVFWKDIKAKGGILLKAPFPRN